MKSSDPTSFLVFRNGSIGNTLAAIPALRALHHRYPEVPISVVVDSIGFELLKPFPWFNCLILYDKNSGIKDHIQFVQLLRSLHPSHAILFKRFFRNGLFAFLSGARFRTGFETLGRAPFLNQTIPYMEATSVVDLNLQLVELLDAKSQGRSLELFLTEEDLCGATNLLQRQNLSPGNYLAVHYGGKTTPPEFVPIHRMTHILNELAPDIAIVCIGNGSWEEQFSVQLSSCIPRVKVILGLPIRTTAAIIKNAFCFVGFNSGPAHIAAAVQTPSLLFFKPEMNVQAEIQKWCPPFEYSIPLIPPSTDDEDKWTRFYELMIQEKNDLLSQNNGVRSQCR